MSHVNNYILTFAADEGEDDDVPAVDEVNARLPSGCRFTRVDQHATGSKHMEVYAYIGGFNWADVDDIAKVVESVQWRWPERVQLLVKEQHADTFRFVPLRISRHGSPAPHRPHH